MVQCCLVRERAIAQLVLERLIDVVAGYLSPSGDDTLLDCFCGVGTFGLLLAGRVKRVVAVEEYPSAVADLRLNAAGLPNVRLAPGAAERGWPSAASGRASPTPQRRIRVSRAFPDC